MRNDILASVSGMASYIAFSFHRLAISAARFLQCSIISESAKYVALLHIIVTYIKEKTIAKLQKLYSQPRNLKA